MSDRRAFHTLTEQTAEHVWSSWVTVRDVFRTTVEHLRRQGAKNSEKPLSTTLAAFDAVRMATVETFEKVAIEMTNRGVGELEEPLRSTLVRIRELKKERL